MISYFIQLRQLITGMDPAYLDIVKIFAGSIGWIGGLTLFMWIREKKKLAVAGIVKPSGPRDR